MSDLTELITKLRAAKADEARAKQARLEAEEAILAHPEVAGALKDEGTLTLDGAKIATGYSRDWDQSVLLSLSPEVNPEFWPFKPELKEDRKLSRVIEKRFPDLWGRIRQALTLKPKKPTLTLTD